MPILMTLFKKLLISFAFDFMWDQMIKYLSEQVQKSDNPYDDALIAWIDGKKEDAKVAIKQVSE